MQRPQAQWKKIVFIYTLQLFSYGTPEVRLVAPNYVKYNNSATLMCNHTVAPDDLHKIEFKKDERKILEYIRDRKEPFRKTPPPGIDFEYSLDGKTIKLNNVRYEATGSYSCLVSSTYPIYTESSNEVKLQVIVPQTENPHITFKKDVYTVGEVLEANCTSSSAYPVPHLTWLINGKEADMTLVTIYPHRQHKRPLMSATSKLAIKVSELHAGDNGRLEIACQATIPDFLIHIKQYADIRNKTVPVDIVVEPTQASSSATLPRGLTPHDLIGILRQSLDSASFDVSDNEEPDVSIGNRIIGGETTNIERYPFMISIQWRHTGRHHCGGTYIMERFILTAAHCLVRNKGHYWVSENPWLLNIVAGSTTLRYSPTWQISNIDNVIPHPFFSFSSMAHDIGITSTTFSITPYVMYALIPTQVSQDLFGEYEGSCEVVGWGKTTVTSQTSSGTLRYASIPLIDTEQCNRLFSYRLHPGQICAGHKEGGIDACQGDSGGPLICNGTQVGIVSWGHGCAVANSPGVYCRVDFYLNWINDTIFNNSSHSLMFKHFEIFGILLITLTTHLYGFIH